MVTSSGQDANRTGFREIDALEAERQRFIFKFLDFQTRLPHMRERKAKMIEVLRLRPGHHVLDAGCGLGDDVREIAELVGSNGRVTGLDFSTLTLDEARRRSAELDQPVTWIQGDVQDLPFDDDAFDAARSERTFMHLADPEKGLRELVRVTRPGGRIVLSDPDWGSVSQVTGMPELQAKLRAHNDTMAPRGSRVGVRLPVLFWQCGIQQIEVLPDLHVGGPDEWRRAEAELGSPQPWCASGSTITVDEGYLTEEEHRTLAAHECELVAAGIHCRTIVNYIVAGTVPPAG